MCGMPGSGPAHNKGSVIEMDAPRGRRTVTLRFLIITITIIIVTVIICFFLCLLMLC